MWKIVAVEQVAPDGVQHEPEGHDEVPPATTEPRTLKRLVGFWLKSPQPEVKP